MLFRWIVKRFFVAAVVMAAALAAEGMALADTLDALVTGGLIDQSPRDGRADSFASAPFIALTDAGEYRAFVEFDLSAVPDGTVLSANVTGRVGPNNSLDVGDRDHLVEFYTADGVIDLDDFDTPGISVGSFSHPSGDRTNFDFDVTGVLHNLLSAGASHVGMRISPQSDPLPFDVLSTSTFFDDQPQLHFELLPSGAGTQQLLPAVDGGVARDDGPWVLSEFGNTVPVQLIDFVEIERRGLIEFSLADLPENAVITDAKLELDLWSRSSGSSGVIPTPIYGYAGDGDLEISDALTPSTVIGSFESESLGANQTEIDHEFINSLLASGEDHLGVAFLPDPDSSSFSYATNEFAATTPSAAPAQLFLTYIVGEEAGLTGDFNDDGVVDAADYTVWRDNLVADDEDAALSGNGDGVGGVGQGDYDVWQANYGTSQPASSTRVPEPTAVLLALGALAVGNLLPKRRALCGST